MDAGPAARDAVAVCICTYRRADVLRGLLERLVDDADDARAVARVAVAVVDDDPDRSATPVLEEFADRFELGLHAAASGSGDIVRARNLVLATGRGVADWLALIDDDCRPDVGWIRHLLAARDAHGAELVSGACVDEAPPGAPSWLTDEPFLDRMTDLPDGRPLEMGPLKNTLVRADRTGPDAVEFRSELGVVGGEDAVFFHDLHRAGIVHVYAAGAVVREEVPPSRATLRYQLRRRYWYGNTEAVTTLYAGEASRARLAAGGVKRTVGAARYLVPSGGRGWWWRYGVAEVLRGAGRVLGAVGVRLRHH